MGQVVTGLARLRTPIRKVGPNDLAGRMAQKGARPRVRPIRKVAPSWASWGPVARQRPKLAF